MANKIKERFQALTAKALMSPGTFDRVLFASVRCVNLVFMVNAMSDKVC